jgi:protein-disulfide isomerase
MRLYFAAMWIARYWRATLDVAGTLAIIAAAGVVGWRVLVPSTPAPALEAMRPASPVAISQRLDTRLVTNVLGAGAIAIVEFSDFECPYCGQFARQIFPEVKRALVDQGRARYVALQFPLEGVHPLAKRASEAAECAGRQGQYWAMHERLYASTAALQPRALPGHRAALGLDEKAFARCMAGEALASIRDDVTAGMALGLRGTPSFFVGVVRADGAIDLTARIDGVTDLATLTQAVTDAAAQPAAGP